MQIDKLKLAEWLYLFDANLNKRGVPLISWDEAAPDIKKIFIEFCSNSAEPEIGGE